MKKETSAEIIDIVASNPSVDVDRVINSPSAVEFVEITKMAFPGSNKDVLLWNGTPVERCAFSLENDTVSMPYGKMIDYNDRSKSFIYVILNNAYILKRYEDGSYVAPDGKTANCSTASIQDSFKIFFGLYKEKIIKRFF